MMITPRPASPRRPAPYWLLMLPMVLATMVSTACSVVPGPAPGGTPSERRPVDRPRESPVTTSPPAAGSAASSAATAATGQTPITITIGDTVITAVLNDTPAAHDLAAQLPLTLTFADFHHVEKIAKLPQPLSLEDVPAGADPDIRDIGYYAPSGDLVLYYGDVGYFNGIVRIGQFDTSIDQIERQGDSFRARIAHA